MLVQPNLCVMTWMRPKYQAISLEIQASILKRKYVLHKYTEAGAQAVTRDASGVALVPGNAGSHRQVSPSYAL
eukprot:gene25158-30703_t